MPARPAQASTTPLPFAWPGAGWVGERIGASDDLGVVFIVFRRRLLSHLPLLERLVWRRRFISSTSPSASAVGVPALKKLGRAQRAELEQLSSRRLYDAEPGKHSFCFSKPISKALYSARSVRFSDCLLACAKPRDIQFRSGLFINSASGP